MAYLVENFLAGGFLVRLLIVYLLLMPSTVFLLVMWLIFEIAERSDIDESGKKNAYSLISRVLAFGVLGILILLSIPLFSPQIYPVISPILNSQFNISTVPYLNNMQYLFIVIVIVFLSRVIESLIRNDSQGSRLIDRLFVSPDNKYNRLSQDSMGSVREPYFYQAMIAPLLIVLIWYTLTSNYQYGINGTGGEARAYYELQVWAKSSTPVNAGFIQAGKSVYGGWRSISQRPVVAPFEIAGYYFYSQAAWQYRQRLVDFFSKYCDFNAEPYRSYGGVYECYQNLDAEGILEFSKNFGADYLVRRISEPRLPFPVTYQNHFYVVYKLENR
jgi:hypothetical protein